jgi:hypothetical protein
MRSIRCATSHILPRSPPPPSDRGLSGRWPHSNPRGHVAFSVDGIRLLQLGSSGFGWQYRGGARVEWVLAAVSGSRFRAAPANNGFGQ